MLCGGHAAGHHRTRTVMISGAQMLWRFSAVVDTEYIHGTNQHVSESHYDGRSGGWRGDDQRRTSSGRLFCFIAGARRPRPDRHRRHRRHRLGEVAEVVQAVAMRGFGRAMDLPVIARR